MGAKVKAKRGGPRPGSGRKALPVEERRRNRLLVSLTDAELEALEDAAAAAGEPAAAYIRRAAALP